MKIPHSSKRGAMTLKLDMAKAYDRVEWGFMEKIMNKMGFSEAWASFAFLIIGCPHGSVIRSRGLRQGDPISPYLFLLCVDSFSHLLTKTASISQIHSAQICRNAPVSSHLFFFCI